MPLLEIATAIAMAIGATLVSTAIVYIVVATITYISDWFDEYRRTHTMDAAAVGFTITESLKSGKIKIIQGVFNTRTGIVEAGRVMEAERQDDQLRELHKQSPVVIYS
ncbi:MAG: hypothetical protein OHK0022_26350 [Roseiflexaceae bacterium]